VDHAVPRNFSQLLALGIVGDVLKGRIDVKERARGVEAPLSQNEADNALEAVGIVGLGQGPEGLDDERVGRVKNGVRIFNT
jgi:hypothetical protein